MLVWKINAYQALLSKGYTTYEIREKGLLSQSTMTKLKRGQSVGWDNIDTLCKLLECQPSDLIEYVSDEQ